MNQSSRDEIGAGNAVVAAVSPDRQENTPPYLKLIADCWEHIFEYLRFEDMGSLGETCKRMHRMVTYYLRENFPEFQFTLNGKEVHLEDYYFSFPVEFSQFVSTLCFSPDGDLNYLLDAEIFSSLKTLMFRNNVLTKDHARYTQDVLPNIEKLELTRCSFTHQIFEQMIDRCRSKLKSLIIPECRLNDQLFLQHYPALEHFKCSPPRWSSKQSIPALKIFLEKHTKLKHFESDYHFLWVNRNPLNETNAQLDQLTVHFREFEDSIPFDQIVVFLKKLQERGFFKTIHLSFDDYTIDMGFEELIQEISALASSLSTLTVLHYIDDSITVLSLLTNLREIHFRELHSGDNEVEIVAKSLVKLEKLTIEKAFSRQLSAFIRHSKSLKTIKIYDYSEVFDLFELNQERKKLENSQPIVIYAPEQHIYLPTKWNSKNMNLNLVKMLRIGPIF